MSEAITTATLLGYGAAGLIAVLAIALILAGTVVRPERRNRFLFWCVAVYVSIWTLFVLYNTVLLTRVFVRMMH
ncbi:MAG: hypothetical protein PW789_09365 [Edaphobacter sp.]|uniref:hypothetical protein n=1 Tax=Edaphobacter sp. TaxID=1934404 RepID=UPI00239D22E8|nr:hypothetical protein [Edaphobacter sp.]MDE1176803.1 hypothetical protein [Edaphobacter sp.]